MERPTATRSCHGGVTPRRAVLADFAQSERGPSHATHRSAFGRTRERWRRLTERRDLLGAALAPPTPGLVVPDQPPRGTRLNPAISGCGPSSRSCVLRVGIILAVMNLECAADHRRGNALVRRSSRGPVWSNHQAPLPSFRSPARTPNVGLSERVRTFCGLDPS
jgi:hypothetical protein